MYDALTVYEGVPVKLLFIAAISHVNTSWFKTECLPEPPAFFVPDKHFNIDRCSAKDGKEFPKGHSSVAGLSEHSANEKLPQI